MQIATSNIYVPGFARLSIRHSWPVVGLWAAILVLAIGLIVGPGSSTTTGTAFRVNPEWAQDDELLLNSGLRTRDPISETAIVRALAEPVADAHFKAMIEQLTAELRIEGSRAGIYAPVLLEPALGRAAAD